MHQNGNVWDAKHCCIKLLGDFLYINENIINEIYEKKLYTVKEIIATKTMQWSSYADKVLSMKKNRRNLNKTFDSFYLFFTAGIRVATFFRILRPNTDTKKHNVNKDHYFLKNHCF